jgi:hypothetical protein
MVFDSAVNAETHDFLMGRLEHRDEIQQKRGPTMKEPKKQIAKLKREQREMQAFLGMLVPVFERDYKKGEWNFEGRETAGRGGKTSHNRVGQ